MNCIKVRDRLAEFTLGVLSQEEAAAVERHLDWCAGCRKEAEELREGSAAFGLGLAPAAPPAALQERVVEHLIGPRPGTKEGVQSATRHALHHRRIRRLAFTTLAAALIAVLSVGWAVSVRYDARRAEQDAREAAREAAAQAANRPGRASDEELGYVTTSDSFSKILSDARQAFSDGLSAARQSAEAKRAADLIEELGAVLRGERRKHSDD